MKLAFIGTGKIINDALYAIEPIAAIERTAIWARPHSRKKAVSIAAEYGIKEIYINYDEFLQQTSADTVYIGLVNNVHYEYAKRALFAGKNVILEKPFTGRYEEACELDRLARERDLFCLEAITVLHNGIFKEMKRNVGRLGPIKMFMGNYSQYSSRYEEYLNGQIAHPFDPDYYGGALYDINIYNIHYCVGLFGEPNAAVYYPNKGYNGVDTSGTLIMQYDGLTAVCTGTKDSDSPCFISVQGEQGYMHLAGKPNTADMLETVYVMFRNNANSEGGMNYEEDSQLNAAAPGWADDGYGGAAGGTAKNPARDASGAIIREKRTETYKAPAFHHRMTQEFTEFADIIDKRDYETGYALQAESVSVLKVIEMALYQD